MTDDETKRKWIQRLLREGGAASLNVSLIQTNFLIIIIIIIVVVVSGGRCVWLLKLYS